MTENKFIRDPTSECDAYVVGEPMELAECETDGHYLCAECEMNKHRKVYDVDYAVIHVYRGAASVEADSPEQAKEIVEAMNFDALGHGLRVGCHRSVRAAEGSVDKMAKAATDEQWAVHGNRALAIMEKAQKAAEEEE